tara:strand:+ start:52 stop:891 length:840 start_codon:yes stop_codon:yes gene_type:complete
MLDLQSSDFLSLEEIKEMAPSVFTTQGSKDTSDKYTHIPTDRVIRDLEVLGWKVADVKEVAARKEDNKGFQKHLVVFRNDDVVITGEDGDIVYPQILLTNSHDGKNSFKFQAGLFRMICENGLVVADESFEDYSIRHMGYDFEALQSLITDMVSNLDLTVESMNKMKQIELNEEQQLELAKKLLDIRLEGTGNAYNDYQPKSINYSQRKEDTGVDLWSVFNRQQENIIEGNFQYFNEEKYGKYENVNIEFASRQARPIKNFKQDMDVNKKMFAAALELV